MNPYFDQYAEWTDTVAQYPETHEGAYLALGITDECGEVTDCVIREHEADLEKECGDVCWYAGRYCYRMLGRSLTEFLGSFDYMVRNSIPIHVALGVISAVEKKRIRDGANWDAATVQAKNDKAAEALKQVYCWVASNLASTGRTLEEAMRQNQGKLNNRLETGTIKGDGDNR